MGEADVNVFTILKHKNMVCVRTHDVLGSTC